MAEQEIKTVLSFKDEFTKRYKKAMDTAQKSTKKTIKTLADTKFSLGGIKTAIAGLAGAAGLGLLSKSVINVGTEFESLHLQFETLLKDTGAATHRMQELAKFADTTPFQLAEIAKASKILQTLGGTALATGDGLRMVGDAAAISDENIADLAVHVGRAYSGLAANRPIGESSARLQELGLVSGEVRNRIESLQQQARGTEAWGVLQKALSTNSGAMDKISKTAGGLISTIKDKLQAGIRQMLDSGVWDIFRGVLQDVKEEIDILLKGNFFGSLGIEILELSLHANRAHTVFATLWNVFQNGIAVLSGVAKQVVNVADRFVLAFQRINAIITDNQEALKRTQEEWEESRKLTIKNMEDIANAVMVNNEDIERAWQSSADRQDAIQSAIAAATKNKIVEVKDFVVATKVSEVRAVQELDQKLANQLIAIRSANQLAIAELDANNFAGRITALQSQYQAELELLKTQEKEEIRRAGKNELKKDQIRDVFDGRRTKAEIKFTKLTNDQQKARVDANLGALSTISGALSQAFGKNKALAITTATIDTFVAANKALASAPPPINIAAAAAVTAAGLVNVGKIAGQNFQRGGIVSGLGTTDKRQPTFLTAGEGILTKDATNRIGAGGIAAMNDRNAPTSSVSNNVTFAPVINASSQEGIVDTLREQYVEFSAMLREFQDKGLVNV